MQQHFTLPLLAWFDQHGRKDLPWQHPRSAYRVWISEIMLQQTQVKTVIPYFNRFLASFPNIQALANAAEDEVLSHWSGLGYYSRARNLHKAAAMIQQDFQGEIPSSIELLIKLPGIGSSTAAAISSLAFDKPAAILDGNVKRVLSRYFLIGAELRPSAINQKLWQIANDCLPSQRCADYTQAIMDLGATCCTSKNPNCEVCPLQTSCLAKKQNQVSHYPIKKAKKSLATKQQQFLLIHNQDQLIYLEKRPPTGIWGGLWCLPSIDMDLCPKTFVQNNYQLQTNAMQELLKLKHTFSHFHLQISALSMQTNTANTGVAEYPGRWFQAGELVGLGLAKPVSEIIQYYLSRTQE